MRAFFLKGLRPEIREPCILDPERNEWSDLAMFEAQKLELNEPNLSFKDWYNQQHAAFNRGEPT